MVTEVKQCPPHYWILESPKGMASHGKCKLCGEEKDFHEPKYYRPDLIRYLKPRRDGARPWGFYDLNKEAILMDVCELDEKEAQKKWDIPRGTWSGLKARWRLPQNRRGSQILPSLPVKEGQ